MFAMRSINSCGAITWTCNIRIIKAYCYVIWISCTTL